LLSLIDQLSFHLALVRVAPMTADNADLSVPKLLPDFFDFLV
jgi:hypothetical protein